MQKKIAVLAWALVLMIGAVSGYLFFFKNNSDCPYDMKMVGQELGGPFSLVDNHGNPFTDADLYAEPSLLYFGYTFCPDVCPFDTARNALAVDIAKESGVNVRPIFVTVDPERDTVEPLNDYVTYTHDDMIGLTGSVEAVDEARAAYKVIANKVEGENPDNYLIDHTAFTYLIADNKVMNIYPRAIRAEELAENMVCHLK